MTTGGAYAHGGRRAMKGTRYVLTALGVFLGLLVMLATSGTDRALAHKEKHTLEQLKAFDEVFIEQITDLDLLLDSLVAGVKQLRRTPSRTSTGCGSSSPSVP